MKTFQDFLHIMVQGPTVQGPNESFSAASKGFGPLVPIEVHYMEKILECFHQKP